MLKIIKLSKDYGKNNVISNINLNIPKGSIVGLVGANGAGKSTILSVLATVIEDYNGEVYFNNENYRGNLKNIRKKIGYVPQQATLFEDLTVKDNIDFWKNNSCKEYINKLINTLQLEKWLKKKVKTLSGGTKNRVNILIGMINNPELIILDEPLVGVSLSVKKNFFDLLKEMSSDGKIIIMSSHEIWEIEGVCTHLLIIKENVVSVFDTIKSVKDQCQNCNMGFGDYVCEEGGL